MSKNDFDKDELARWFIFNTTCWACGKNHANCFHHALGRKTNHILSAVPLNNHECHLPVHGLIRMEKSTALFLQTTLRYLLAEGYQLTEENDGEFLQKYKKYYDLDVGSSVPRDPGAVSQASLGAECENALGPEIQVE